jgi:RimJ/RimL family protein N-acetyltransferase
MNSEKIIYQGKTKTGLGLTIRYLELIDVVALTDFINKISQEKTFVTFQGEKILLEDEKKYVAQKVELVKEKKSVHLLAFIDNELVAVSDIDMKDKTESHVGGFGLIVSKKHRGHGIGKIIMTTVIKEAKKELKDLKIVTLEVFANNPIAQNLYKKLGFIHFGQLLEGSKYKGKFIDRIYMYKKLKC